MAELGCLGGHLLGSVPRKANLKNFFFCFARGRTGFGLTDKLTDWLAEGHLYTGGGEFRVGVSNSP